MIEVTPTNEYKKDGNKYKQAYTFQKIHMEEVDLSKIDIDGVELEWVDEGHSFLWTYASDVKIIVTMDRILCDEEQHIYYSQKTAYFALYSLDENGWVSGFRKAR